MSYLILPPPTERIAESFSPRVRVLLAVLLALLFLLQASVWHGDGSDRPAAPQDLATLDLQSEELGDEEFPDDVWAEQPSVESDHALHGFVLGALVMALFIPRHRHGGQRATSLDQSPPHRPPIAG